MSYRCQLCSTAVRHGTSLLKHVTYRRVLNRVEVACETPVCLTCYQSLGNGMTLSQIVGAYRKLAAAKEPRPVVKQIAPVITPPAYVEPAASPVTSDPIDF